MKQVLKAIFTSFIQVTQPTNSFAMSKNLVGLFKKTDKTNYHLVSINPFSNDK